MSVAQLLCFGGTPCKMYIAKNSREKKGVNTAILCYSIGEWRSIEFKFQNINKIQNCNLPPVH